VLKYIESRLFSIFDLGPKQQQQQQKAPSSYNNKPFLIF
jgi:hypothetical protein